MEGVISDKSESLGCCRFHLLSDLFHGFTRKRLFVLLSRDDLLGEFTQLLNILTGINLRPLNGIFVPSTGDGWSWRGRKKEPHRHGEAGRVGAQRLDAEGAGEAGGLRVCLAIGHGSGAAYIAVGCSCSPLLKQRRQLRCSVVIEVNEDDHQNVA